MSFVTWLLSLLFAAPPSRPLWNLPSPVLEPSQPLRFLGLLSFQLLGLFLFCTLPLSFYLPFLSLESWASSTLPIKLFFFKKKQAYFMWFRWGGFLCPTLRGWLAGTWSGQPVTVSQTFGHRNWLKDKQVIHVGPIEVLPRKPQKRQFLFSGLTGSTGERGP